MKSFRESKGFGFILPEASDESPGGDLFFHVADVERRPGELHLFLPRGEPVEFVAVKDHRGRPRAIRVRRVEQAAPRSGRAPGPEAA